MKYWLKLNKLRAVRKRVKFFMSYIRYIIFCCYFVARTETATKIMGQSKEPIRLRQRKTASGNTTLYLDIYLNGKRSYEYLKLYHIPETNRKDSWTAKSSCFIFRKFINSHSSTKYPKTDSRKLLPYDKSNQERVQNNS